jgi:hypothetical protein
MKSVATILLAFAISLVGFKAYSIENPTPGYYKAQKVVYHNDGGTPDNAAYSKRMLNSMKNHVEAMAAGKAKLEIRVVSHSGGVEMFQLANTDKDIAGRIDALKASGVRFLICNNTLKERKIDWHTLYGVKEDDIVPAGVAEVIRLQAMGFFYIHL